MQKMILILLITLCAFFVQAADRITKQERKGPVLVVYYESGRATTNSLFMSMSPDVIREIEQQRAEKQVVQALKAVVADTRSNIVETANLSDIAIAELYLAQTKKDASELMAISPTNTVEYLIGSGIRDDLQKQ